MKTQKISVFYPVFCLALRKVRNWKKREKLITESLFQCKKSEAYIRCIFFSFLPLLFLLPTHMGSDMMNEGHLPTHLLNVSKRKPIK